MKLALCLFKYFPFGGLQRDFMRIANGLVANGHQVDVYCFAWQGEIPSHIKVHILASRKIRNASKCFAFSSQLQKILCKKSYDKVIGFNKMAGLDWYFAADICYQDDIKTNKGCLFHLSSRARKYIALEKAVFTTNTHILSLSDKQKQLYQKYYQTPDKYFHSIPCGIEKNDLSSKQIQTYQQKIREHYLITDKTKLLLMVGSDYRRKGLDRAISAMAHLLQNKNQTYRLFVIGKGKIAPYQKLIKKHQLQNHIHLLGPREDVREFYCAADLLLHPAYQENTGTVIAESLTYGLPVITSDACGYAYHVSKANAGAVISLPFAQDDFNHAISSADSAKIAAWRKNALAYAKQTDFYSLVKQVIQLIES